MDLVAHHSWWTSPRLYTEIQVVYPMTRRKRGANENRRDVIEGITLWNNEPANYAFWLALGKSRQRVKNFYRCHIYEGSVWNPDHFTNLANLVALPKSLESLSEWTPVRDLLKYHSFRSYGYRGPNGIDPHKPNYYPSMWAHQLNLPHDHFDLVLTKLREQQKRRPQFRNAEGRPSAGN